MWSQHLLDLALFSSGPPQLFTVQVIAHHQRTSRMSTTRGARFALEKMSNLLNDIACRLLGKQVQLLIPPVQEQLRSCGSFHGTPSAENISFSVLDAIITPKFRSVYNTMCSTAPHQLQSSVSSLGHALRQTINLVGSVRGLSCLLTIACFD